MENAALPASYIVSLEQRLSALTAERDSLRSTAERLSSERDTLQGVVVISFTLPIHSPLI